MIVCFSTTAFAQGTAAEAKTANTRCTEPTDTPLGHQRQVMSIGAPHNQGVAHIILWGSEGVPPKSAAGVQRYGQ
jgi:hypothetical protein